MKGLTAVVVLAVLLGVSLEGCVGSGMGYGFASSKLQIQQRRVDRLRNSIDGLRSKVEVAHSNRDMDSINQLDKRLLILDVPNCDEGSVRCGLSEQCMSDLLFCDGVQDCNNNYDEESCSNVPITGSFWAGDLYRARCGFVENSHLRLFITGHNHKYYFGSRIGITASFVVKYPRGSGMHTDSYNMVGQYSFGKQELDIDAPHNEFELRCTTIRSDSWMSCEIVQMTGGNSCGHAHLVIQP
uniref:L1 linker protein of V1 giant hemoglobin n=1 Tax=Lamellibrachia satsuma TaxID=104711 RepID=A0A125SXX9_LAMSA|nr:L1 linker protein of V1 giant hemoglobin [Lamellibrachia satsuma]